MLIEATDAREIGYGSDVESLITPTDGSIIMVSRLEVGITSSLPQPSNNQPLVDGPETLTAYEAQSTVDGQSLAGSPEPPYVPEQSRYDAPARQKTRAARVMKDGLTFGIVSDDSWLQALQKAALADEDRAANPEADAEGVDAAPAENLNPDCPTMGNFWLSLPGGARCTVRMHHERLPIADAAAAASNRGSTLPFGTILTYSMSTGQVVRVFSDGTVRLSCPIKLGQGGAAHDAAPPAASACVGAGVAAQNGGAAVPGGPEDVELWRTITPIGSLTRRLLSGRVEVLHADGTCASRDPTLEELQERLQSLKSELKGSGKHHVEFVERLCRALEARADEAVAGAPGHWVVTRPDGAVFGRAPAPPHRDTGDAPAEEGADAPPATPKPSLLEQLGGVLVEGGTMIEYPMPSVSSWLQEDLQTQHKTRSNAVGLACFEDPHSLQKVCVHADGTRFVWTARGSGYDLSIAKEPLPLVTCDAETGVRVMVECADGAVIEAVPQALARGGALQPTDPEQPHFLERSTHARVVLKCRGGASVVSTGTGEVQLLTRTVGEELQPDGLCYMAFCHEDSLRLDDSGVIYELRGDQTVNLPSEDEGLRSPRCLVSEKASMALGAERHVVPEKPPTPRLFVVYGDGEAEELLASEAAGGLLEAAEADPLASVMEETLEPKADGEAGLVGCTSHTIFRKKFPDTPVTPPEASIALPEGLDLAGSVYSMATSSHQASLPVPPPSYIEFRQLVQYPAIDEETREMFRGTLAQYRKWEAELVTKTRLALQGGESKKKEAKGKKKDEKAEKNEKKEKRKKKGRQSITADQDEQAQQVEKEIKTFVNDLQLTAFEHEVQALQFRAAQVPEPSSKMLLDKALATQKVEEVQESADVAEAEALETAAAFVMEDPEAEAEAGEVPSVAFTMSVKNVDHVVLFGNAEMLAAFEASIKESVALRAGHGVVPEDVQMALSAGSVIVDTTVAAPSRASANAVQSTLSSDLDLTRLVATSLNSVPGISSANVTITSPPVLQVSAPDAAEAASLGDADRDGHGPMTSGTTTPATRRSPKRGRARAAVAQEGPIFSYFRSELGLQFLMETSALDEPRPAKVKTSRPPEQTASKKKTDPWNPRLVGEPEPAEEQQEHEVGTAPMHLGEDTLHEGEEDEVEDVGGPYMHYDGPNATFGPSGCFQEQQMPFSPSSRLPIAPERLENPRGPHPDKRGANWDVYGEQRSPKKPVSQAYVAINADYLEVEGQTDRRVRTCSVSHKKNAAKAPSVATVRKTGIHAIGLTGEVGAKEILGEAVDALDEHWRLSSTMQGLGNENSLVDVRPGACRFGPLRRGSLYRMAFYLRNLDVDVTRFNVAKVKSELGFVNVHYQPGHLAPGMAAKIIVEVAAHVPAKIEQLVEVKLKAHVVRVPVTARVFDAEEYDRLDAESLALHGRRIGRHRERSENNKPGPVQLVVDEAYCRKVLGENYLVPPPDFADVAPFDELS